MLEGTSVIADPERFGRDVHVTCPEHESEREWVRDAFDAWTWTRKGRALGDMLPRPAAWVTRACLLLDGEFAAYEAEEMKDRTPGGDG